MNEDFIDLLTALREEGVEFVIVGAHALAAHGIVRATGAIDVLVRPSGDNAARVVSALERFGAPLAAHGVTREDFTRADNVYQIGLPPRRIDVLTSIDGVSFDEAVATKLEATVGGIELPFLGRAALIRNKRATKRPKDLLDAEALERIDAK